jgi:hypothetical protein
MPAINFYPRFADAVVSGRIRQAIRLRKVDYGGLVALCSGSRPLGVGRVHMVRDVLVEYRRYFPVVRLDGVSLSSKGMDDFANKCGFPGIEELIDFYAEYHTMPLRGHLVVWELVNQEEQAVPA